MRIFAFLTDCAVVDRIIDHLKLTFVAERPPPSPCLSRTPYGCRGEERMVLRTSPLVLYRFVGEHLSYSWLPGTFRRFMSLLSP